MKDEIEGAWAALGAVIDRRSLVQMSVASPAAVQGQGALPAQALGGPPDVFAHRPHAVQSRIPPVTQAITLLGYWAADDGGAARYVRTPSQPAHNGWFRSADGSFWTLAERTVTAAMFGATPAVEDHTSAIQGFFDYVAKVTVDHAVLAGVLNVSRTVTLDGALSPTVTSSYEITARITATAPMRNVVEFKNLTVCTFRGRLHVIGRGSEPYLSRQCVNGVLISYCGGCTFDGFYVENMYADGVRIERNPTNNNLLHVGSIYTKRCGSGYVSPGAAVSLTARYTMERNSGDLNSFNQFTRLRVSATPDPYIDPATRAVVVYIRDQPYYVRAINHQAGTIDVYPWIDATVQPGTLTYMFGKALGIYGSDSNVIGATLVSSLRGGGALELSCLYGPMIDRVLSEGGGAAVTVAQSPEGQVFGGFIGQLYCEGNAIDILAIGVANYGVTIGAVSAFDSDNSKVVALYPVRGKDNALSQDGLRGINIIAQDGMFYREKRAGTIDAITLDFNRPNRINSVYRGDSLAVAIAPLSPNAERLWGYDGGVLFTLVGSGPRGEPTGEIRFTPPAGTTINGAPIGSFTGFSGPASFAISFDRKSSRWQVAALSGQAPEGRTGRTAKGDGDVTLTPYVDANLVVFGSLTTRRTVTLDRRGAVAGNVWKIVRPSRDPFDLDVGGLKLLKAGQWCTVEYDGAAFVLTGSGAL